MTEVFAGLDTGLVVFLLAASFVGSFITVALGIGGGVLLLALMASALPPLALIPVHGVIQFGSNITRAAVMIRHTYWPPVLAFGLGTILGVGVGGSLSLEIPAWLVQIGVGGFVIWSITQRPPVWLTRWPALTGGISSCLTMFFGATGVFVANLVTSFDLPRQTHVATHAVLMTLQHCLKIIAFALLGFAFTPWIWFILAMIVSGFVGTLIGRQVLLRINDNVFKRALNIVLIVLALRLIWQGILAAQQG